MRTFLVAQRVKCLPTVCETWVQTLGREDLLQKEMATHSSTLAWKISWMEEPGRLQSMGVTKSWMTEQLHFHFHLEWTNKPGKGYIQHTDNDGVTDQTQLHHAFLLPTEAQGKFCGFQSPLRVKTFQAGEPRAMACSLLVSVPDRIGLSALRVQLTPMI